MGLPALRPTVGFVLAASVTLAAALRAQAIDQREAPEVAKLQFRGVSHVSRGELSRSIATQQSHCRSVLLVPFCLLSHSNLFVEKHYLDETELKRDVLRIKVFYWRRGYRETQVDTSVSRIKGRTDDRRVVFTITEGPPTVVQRIAVARPESVLTNGDISKAMLLRAGQPLNLLDLDSSRVLLRDRLWDKGYSDAEITDTVLVQDSLRVAQVQLSIDPRWLARVGDISVKGNQAVATSTIGNMLTLHAGEIYKRREVIESQRNLYSSNLFKHAVIYVPPRSDSLKRLNISVEEAPFRSVRLSAGFNTRDFLQTEARFTHYNFLGGARELDFRAVLSNILAPQLNGSGIFQDVTGGLPSDEAAPFLRPEYQASIDLTQPWFENVHNTLSVGVFAHRQSYPAIFIDKGYGAQASFTRTVALRTPLSLVYRYELSSVEAGDLYFCVNYGVCERPTIDALRSNPTLSPVSLDFFADHTDQPLDPRDGWTARFDAEHASKYTLSDFHYNRISGEATRYQPMGHAVLAGRIRFGWVGSLGSNLGLADTLGNAILHPRKRFYAGGAQSVRGYGENQLGPRVLTVDPQFLIQAGCTAASIASGDCNPQGVSSTNFVPRPTGGTALLEGNIEYRVPFAKHFEWAVFLDGAFVGTGSLQEVTKGAGALTPGFGARYLSPVGPIRVDIGVRPTLTEDLPVLTEIVDSTGARHLVRLKVPKTYDPLEGSHGIRQVLDRLTLHLSIGQAF